MVRADVAGVVALALASFGCRSPTQIAVTVTTDVACAGTTGATDTVTDTAILAGSSFAAPNGPPTSVSESCSPDGTVQYLGELVLFPTGSSAQQVDVVVVTGLNGVHASSCAPPYTNCIVEERQWNFAAHDAISATVLMPQSCVGVVCEPGTTCYNASECVPVTSCPFGGCGLGAGTVAPSDGGAPGDSGVDAPVDAPRETAAADAPIDTAAPDTAVDSSSEAAPDAPVDTGPVDTGMQDTAAAAYFLEVAVSGLSPTAVIGIQITTSGSVMPAGDGPHSYMLPNGTSYDVVIAASPGYLCSVSGGMGMIEGANPPAVAIACSSTGPSDGGNSGPIIVTVSGLDPGASVTVEDGNGNGLTLTQNGSAAFGAVLAAGTPYDVTVTAPPAGEMCSVGMGTGTTMAGMSPMVGLTCTASPGSGAGTGATAIAAGESHTCAVLEGGVQCWGSNASNQLGQLTPGAPPISAVPVPVAEVGSAQNMIVAGLNHTCVVVDEGMPSVDCWGDNTYGQLGYGSPGEGGGQPGEVMNLGGNIMGLAAGAHHTCALVSGYIYCWGDNSSNQLGWDAGAMSSLPGQVSVVVEATFVTAGQDFTCAGNFLNQTVYCWGNNVDGQFANGMMASSPTPTPATEIDPLFFSQMSAGDEYACGVNTNGPSAVVDCWGTNASGELGNGSLATPQPAPGSVDFGGTALSSSVTIAASLGDPSIPVAGHTCLLDGLATIYCWGAGSAGQLGNGLAMIAADTPVMVNSFGGATAIAVGVQHSCGINLTGQVYCWGANMSGQLGDGTTMSSATPMPVTFP